MNEPATLRAEALAAVKKAESLAALEDVRVAYLGKKGHVTEALKALGSIPAEERKAAGAAINTVKDAVTRAIEARLIILKEEELNARIASESVDVTLPPRPRPQGKVHPITQVTEELIRLFGDLGFVVAEGPEIEDDYHNFTALNFPPAHPARQMHDTFYLTDDVQDAHGKQMLLRTHTSPVQIRAMKEATPPFRFLSPGATYRCDSDITHTPKFHQVEGLVIDRDINMGHLKGCLHQALTAFFGVEELPIRFRPSFFPFTEPSAEVDIGCSRKNGELKIGAGEDWLEIAGCGMVHPNVLKNCDIDPAQWQGFAFGMGIERLAMLKYGIPDLRTFFESDVRWLNHYGFDAFDIAGGAK